MKKALEFLGAFELGLVFFAVVVVLGSVKTDALEVPDQLSIFTTIFLGIFSGLTALEIGQGCFSLVESGTRIAYFSDLQGSRRFFRLTTRPRSLKMVY